MGHVVQTNGDYTIKTGEGNKILLDTGTNVGEVRVTGNLIVTGDTLTVSANNLNVKDNIIFINQYPPEDYEPNTEVPLPEGVILDYAGIQIDRGTLMPASFLFDETAKSWILVEGSPESTFNYSNSNLRLQRIFTDPATDNGDLTLIGFGTGVVKVLGTTNYANQVTDDDDIPNKKYVDDAIIATSSFQIIRGNTRVIAFDTSDPLDQSFFSSNIGGYPPFPEQDQIAIIVNNRRVAVFTEQEFTMRGLSIFAEDPKGLDIEGGEEGISEAITIQARETNSGIRLETNGTGKVEISYALQFDPVGVNITPAKVDNTTVLYNGPVSSGTSGLYVVNNDYRDEVILRNRALLYSIIF
jgi:hypothetical protein